MQNDITVFSTCQRHFGTEKSGLDTISKPKRPEGYQCRRRGHEALSARWLLAADGSYTGLSPIQNKSVPALQLGVTGLYLGWFYFRSDIESPDGYFYKVRRLLTKSARAAATETPKLTR